MKTKSSIGSEYKILEQYSHDQLSKIAKKIHRFEKVTNEDAVILDLAAKKAELDGEKSKVKQRFFCNFDLTFIIYQSLVQQIIVKTL